MITSSAKCQIRHFHVVVVQWRQSCCFANLNLFANFAVHVEVAVVVAQIPQHFSQTTKEIPSRLNTNAKMFHASSAIATVKITGQASVTFLPLWNHFTCWSVNETLCENFTLQRLDSYLAFVTVASNRWSKSRRENDFFFSFDVAHESLRYCPFCENSRSVEHVVWLAVV